MINNPRSFVTRLHKVRVSLDVDVVDSMYVGRMTTKFEFQLEPSR